MQAITTKYVGPTNFRGSRVIAKTASGLRITRDWDDALNIDENHLKAAQALAEQMGWTGHWFGGSMDVGNCYVLADGAESFTIARKVPA